MRYTGNICSECGAPIYASRYSVHSGTLCSACESPFEDYARDEQKELINETDPDQRVCPKCGSMALNVIADKVVECQQCGVLSEQATDTGAGVLGTLLAGVLLAGLGVLLMSF